MIVYKNCGSVTKVTLDGEFIGFMKELSDGRIEFNPNPEITLKAKILSGWHEATDFIQKEFMEGNLDH